MSTSAVRAVLLGILLANGACGTDIQPAAPGENPEAAKMSDSQAWQFSEEEWRARLDPLQFEVLRRSATEPPGTGALLGEHRVGTFACAGCAAGLFRSEAKFDSGSGWPSFHSAMAAGAVGTRDDSSHGMQRTEIHCRRCGGHLGHVFDDGPQPSGKRYCVNSAALTFTAGESDNGGR